MNKEYQNFDLFLKWHEPNPEDSNQVGQVSVAYGSLNNRENPTPYFKLNAQDALSILMSSNVRGQMESSKLVAAGRQVADLLLPAGRSGIRAAFREFWRRQKENNKGVRLRLFYPVVDLATEVNVITQLLAIPWEYIYFPDPADSKTEDPQHFLCRNPNISIVHSLKTSAELDAASPKPVDRLLAQLEYLSWLGDDPNNETNNSAMFDDFADELDPLNIIVDTSFIGSGPTNFNTRKPPSTAEPDDVVQALFDNDLVHLVFHSEPSRIYLKNGAGSNLSAAELLAVYDGFQDNIGAKAVILIGCNSGDGGRSIAAALHRVNVPVVISFTASIKPDDARAFVDGFYKAFAEHPDHGLEQAVTYGRRLMFDIPSDGLKWYAGFGTPRLFLSRPDSVLIPEKLLFGSDEMIQDFDAQISSLLPEVGIKQSNEDLDKIKDWVEHGQKRWFFVAGREGIGKSTLVAQLIDWVKDRKKHKIVYHFCRRNGPLFPGHPADPLAFIRYSLAPQLRKNFVNYGDSVPEGRYPLLVGNKLQAIKDFVLEPLAKIVVPGVEPPLIVIDDVHFFREGHGFENSILKLLIDHWDDLTNVARFLITADMTNPIAQQELERLLGDPDLRLQPEQAQLETVQRGLKPEAIGNIISPLKMRGGSLRPLPLVYETANRFGASPIKFYRQIPLEVAASPQGVNVLYQTAITSITQTDGSSIGQKAQDMLDVLATAYEPLFPCDVAALIGVDNREMADLQAKLTPFLREIAPDKPLSLFHDSLKTYLQRDIVRRGRLAAVHDRFVAAAQPAEKNWAAMKSWVNLTGTAWGRSCGLENEKLADKGSRRKSQPLSAISHYVRRYLTLHAYEAYRTSGLDDPQRSQRAKTFIDLVCDPAFRTVRRVEVGREAALQDIRNVLRVVYTQQALPLGAGDKQAVAAIDHLLTANDPAATARLLELEGQLRLGKKGQAALAKFLGLA